VTLLAFTAALALFASLHLGSHRATVYSGPCDGQGTVMADGTRIDGAGHLWHSGHRVSDDALASTFLPLGSHVLFARRVFGSRGWTVRDTGGAFDLYRPNCNYAGWPGLQNPVLTFSVTR
jgi:hypothetical protein